jgi:hypothetical protein
MQIPKRHETLGARLLSELVRRSAAGMLFDFGQRQRLRQIDDRQELRACLEKWGLRQIDTSGSERQIIEALWSANLPGWCSRIITSDSEEQSTGARWSANARGWSAIIIDCGLHVLWFAAEVVWFFLSLSL